MFFQEEDSASAEASSYWNVLFDYIDYKEARRKWYMLDKQLIEANPEEFKPEDIAAAALKNLLSQNRDEAISEVSKLIVKEYQTRRVIKEKEADVNKAKESLGKTMEALKKIRGGDLSVLFKAAGGGDKEKSDTRDGGRDD